MTPPPSPTAAWSRSESEPGAGEMRVCVASDLHLFATRSSAHERLNEIRDAAEESDLFILNGDTFDFRWATRPGVEANVESAIAWLDGLVAAHPSTHFVYILGNHDSATPFVEALHALSRQRPNLEWRPLAYILGGLIFLHGEAATSRRVRDAVSLVAARHRTTRRDKRNKTSRRAYDLAVQLRLHNVVRLIHSRRRSARRILSFLRAVEPEAMRTATDVYFGHTHVPFRDYVYQEVRLHNTGSMIRHMRANIMRLNVAA